MPAQTAGAASVVLYLITLFFTVFPVFCAASSEAAAVEDLSPLAFMIDMEAISSIKALLRPVTKSGCASGPQNSQPRRFPARLKGLFRRLENCSVGLPAQESGNVEIAVVEGVFKQIPSMA